jgi:transcriptional regulator with XRE-family HTH domain
MIHAYAETYLSDAQSNLGDMMHYAVHRCKYQADDFFSFFLISGVAAEFERGNPRFIAGMSGAELASEVNYRVCGRLLTAAPAAVGTSAERWAGRAMAYYQWYSGCRFSELQAALPFSQAVELYAALRDTNFHRFSEAVEERLAHQEAMGTSALARIRKRCGMSQKSLADRSGVALRMIQLYEQKQNDINRAQAAALRDLARALHCRMEDLLEPDLRMQETARSAPTLDVVWRRICRCAGETFHTAGGMAYTYEISDGQICLKKRACRIPCSDVGLALTVPAPTVTRLQRMKLQGPSYLLGILTDARIRS